MERQALVLRSLCMNNIPIPTRGGSFSQLARYVFVGIVTNLLGYLAYLLLTRLGVAPALAVTYLYGIGAAIGYLGHRNVTFRDQGGILGSGVRYLLIHCCGYAINIALLVVFVGKLGYPHQYVQAIAISVVAGFLFLSFKFIVFRDKDTSKMERPLNGVG